MFKGKAFCEAFIYLYSSQSWTEQEKSKVIEDFLKVHTNTFKMTNVRVLEEYFHEDKQEFSLQLALYSEILVPYDNRISHLNDYRINACRLFRKQFPKVGAVMAHSIDVYTPLRWKGYKGQVYKESRSYRL
ncbi:hypothetical protein BTS2_2919 [Bacillus sp. TS-2]|nr:hypothetical protein BTS2_2919 [Bacillus sp. TS-2]